MLTPFGTKTITGVRKQGLPDLLKNLPHRLLDQSVHYGRNSKQPDTALRFLDFLSSYREWPICAVEQFLFYLRPVPSHIARKLIDCHTVDTWCAFIRPNPLEGSMHILPLTDYLHELAASLIYPHHSVEGTVRAFVSTATSRLFDSPGSFYQLLCPLLTSLMK
jgi:hypothetical protein